MIIDTVHNPETLKNEQVKNKPPATFEDQTLEVCDTLMRGKEPTVHQFFYPLKEKYCSK